MTKTHPRSAKALHVGVVREGRFIEDRWFQGEIHITVGTAEKNTFALPLSTLPSMLPLFMHKQGKLLLQFDEKARGKLNYRGREMELADCRKQGLAVPHAGFFELPLGDEARGRITIGEVSFVFNFAPPPPVAPKPVLPKEARGTIWNVTDHTFASILLVSLVLHACAIAAISRRDLPPEDAAMEEIPDRFAKLLIPEKPPEVEQPKEEEKPAEEPEEKKEDKKEAKKEEPPKDSAEHKADVQKAVAQKGLVKILGSVGQGQGGALANVLAAGGGFSDDIGAALAGAGGVAIATEAGGGARRGEGAAQAASIGGIATSGGGNVKLREKQDVAVHGSVSSDGDAEVESDSVDKDALARFIKMRIGGIRNCYESQLKRSPNLRGKLVVRFTIGTLGQVIEVSIDSDTIGSDDVASCVMRQVKLWRFPFKPPSDTPVSFPFLFSPAG
jgi:hypothetical protein